MRGYEYIKLKRHEQEMSLRELAAKSGISHNYIKKLEDGISEPTIEYLQKLLHALGVDMYQYLKVTDYIGVRKPSNQMAEGVGFEPTVESPPQRFSRPSPSTARPPLRVCRKLKV